jgi:hypothetical protein
MKKRGMTCPFEDRFGTEGEVHAGSRYSSNFEGG